MSETNGTLKIKNSKLLIARDAINSIGILNKAPKGVFGLAKNLSRLNTALEPLEDTRRKLVKEVFGDVKDIKPDTPGQERFRESYEQVLETEVEFQPHRITEADLNLEVNSLSPAQVAHISWMISDWEKKE